jgi:UPF0176 protein
MTQVVATFYKFVSLPDFAEKREPLLSYCLSQGVKGTILLAEEGINGTIAAASQALIDSVFAFLGCDPRLANLEYKLSPAEALPFERMKVKLKREIVTIGLPEVNPSQQVGIYVNPQDWNALISDPEVVVIDTRNDYEVKIGTFQRAQNPQTQSFRQFPEYVRQNLNPNTHKKIAMFCTGGIRCEKASAFMLSQGFEAVYHLKGGILKYLEEVPSEESLWQGECFVFDERVALQQSLAPGHYEMCRSCGHPISELDRQSQKYEERISCPNCFDTLSSTSSLLKRKGSKSGKELLDFS